MAVLAPFLEERANGKLVLFDKGALAKAMQESVGDAIFTAYDGSARSVEVKTEERFTGNVFLETWSNRNLVNRESYVCRGNNPGWMLKSSSELLFYYFLGNDHLYVFDFLRLKRWAFASPSSLGFDGRLSDFREVPQSRYSQLNDTRGRIVPLEILRKEVGYRLFYPTQLHLFEREVQL
ncbi:MAG TPA: hypothetical protein VNH19_24010 [Candidatus Limnocylindrales bacterium]|nr:hypothetical protein [Candidatus Limnocylindrales bacterium]